MGADQWLANVFAPLLGRESLAYGSDADILRGQLRALHDCGVLSDEAHADAEQRLDTAIEIARPRARFDIRPAGTTEPTPTPAVRLQRVFAVAQPLADVDGMPLILTSVEL